MEKNTAHKINKTQKTNGALVSRSKQNAIRKYPRKNGEKKAQQLHLQIVLLTRFQHEVEIEEEEGKKRKVLQELTKDFVGSIGLALKSIFLNDWLNNTGTTATTNNELERKVSKKIINISVKRCQSNQ